MLVEVSVNPVRKRLQLLQQRTRCAEIRTFFGVSRTRCRHWVPHSPALQARAFDRSATCPKWCNGPKRNALALWAEVRRPRGVAIGVAIDCDTQRAPIGPSCYAAFSRLSPWNVPAAGKPCASLPSSRPAMSSRSVVVEHAPPDPPDESGAGRGFSVKS